MDTAPPPDSVSPTPYTLLTMGRVGLYPPAANALGDAGGAVGRSGGMPLPSGSDHPGGQPLIAPGKPLALLTYLALSPGRTASREFLLDLLWADMDDVRARHALRQTVWQLRQLLGEAAFEGREEIHLALPVQTDRDQFLAAVEAGRLEEAIERYTGPFLPGFAAPGGAEFEQWADGERDHLRSLFIRSASTLARRLLGKGHPRDAVRLARRIRTAEPFQEGGWRLLLESLQAANDRVQVLVEADALENLLRMEGREPEAATAAALRRARQTPEPATSAERATNLVAELVGRDREFSSLTQAWEQARHGPAATVLLIGPAGLGKSRLLHDFHARLKTLGARTVLVRANSGERDLPCALAADLAGALGELPGAAAVAPATAATLVALNPALSAHFGVAPQHIAGDQVLQRTIAIAELISAVAYEAPIAILIDDLHWSDQTSLRIVQGVRSRIATARVLLVTTTRPSRSDSREGAETTVLALAPLTLSEVGSLVGSIARPPAGPDGEFLISTLWRASGGSPLHVLEALQQVLDAGFLALDGEHWRLVDLNRLVQEVSRGQSIAGRLQGLDRPASYLLTLLATAGAPCSTELLMLAAARESSGLTETLHRLERRGFITQVRGEWEPAHDEIGAAALDVADPNTRRAASRALAEALTCTGRVDEQTLRRTVQLLLQAEADEEIAPLLLAQRPGSWRGQSADSQRAALVELTGLAPDDPRLAPVLRALPARPRWHTPVLATTAATLLLTAVFALTRPDAVPMDPQVLLILEDASENSEFRRAVIRPAQWDRGEPIQTDPVRGAFPDRAFVRGTGSIRRTATGWEVLHSPFVDNRRTNEIARTTSAGTEMLTNTHRDDVSPEPSPDGAWIVYSTSQWSPLGDDHLDLAIMDRDGKAVRQLTRGATTDYHPQWDPTGTRLAFLRRHIELKPLEVCVITFEGVELGCHALPGGDADQLVGWLNTASLLVRQSAAQGLGLVRLDLETGDVSQVWPNRAEHASVSDDGRWIACKCAPGPGSPAEWIVFRSTDRSESRTLAVPTAPTVRMLDWYVPGNSTQAIASITIAGVPEHIARDTPFRPRLDAHTPTGRPTAVPGRVLRWWTPDSLSARVNPATGEITPLGEATIRLFASAGGWRTDSALVEIRGASSTLVLSESWTRLDSTRWRSFGAPRPYLATGPGNIRGVVPGGDGSFLSGVYTPESWAAAIGFGLEVVVSIPVTRAKWQSLAVSFWPSTPAFDRLLSAWDHIEGEHPREFNPTEANCSFGYPYTEGLSGLGGIAALGRGQLERVPAPPELPTGQWHTVRLQLFPDGSCGLALNGVARWRSHPLAPWEARLRVMLAGQAVQSRPMVGKLELWTGVRPDVDWSALDSLP